MTLADRQRVQRETARAEIGRRLEAVRNRLRWVHAEGISLSALQRSLQWPSGVGVPAVLRELRDRGEAVERDGRWFDPAHLAPTASGATPVPKKPSTFGDRLLHARQALGLSQGDLRALLGCHSSYVSRAERGLVRTLSPEIQAWLDAVDPLLDDPTAALLAGEQAVRALLAPLASPSPSPDTPTAPRDAEADTAGASGDGLAGVAAAAAEGAARLAEAEARWRAGATVASAAGMSPPPPFPTSGHVAAKDPAPPLQTRRALHLELDAAKVRIADLEADLARQAQEASALRTERDGLSLTLADVRGQLAEEQARRQKLRELYDRDAAHASRTISAERAQRQAAEAERDEGEALRQAIRGAWQGRFPRATASPDASPLLLLGMLLGSSWRSE